MSSNTTGGSVSLTTAISTITSTLPSSTTTFESTITSSSVIITSIPSSTIIVAPSSISSSSSIFSPEPSSSSIVVVSTYTPPTTNPTIAPSVVIVTSTLPAPTPEPPTSIISSAKTSTTSSSSPSALNASGSGSSGKGGLGTGAKIAIAVVIPVVVVAALIVFGLWFWRKRKARKSNEELRKNEMAEYGFNPNHDPTLAAAGVAGAAYAEDASDAPEDNSGYRGWGNTSSNRKASTTLGSNSRPAGLAVSDTGSQPGGYQHQGSSPNSGDPLMPSHPEQDDGVGAMGAGAAAGAGGAVLARHRSGNNGDIRRGPSNASSAYSNGPPHSEASSDVPGVPGHYYEQEVPYNVYNNGGPYGDGSYGGNNGQPVIRDVQARRNTRIERAPTMPQTQGGIAQNF